MGSSNMLFARNARFESTFPDLGLNPLAVARHSDAENGPRLGLYQPDPQLISRSLFSREDTSDTCNDGMGLPDYSPEAECAYQEAPFFNVLAAFWIQFMTHDWFSHTQEGRNRPDLVSVGCVSEAAIAMGCRPGDRMERSLYANEGAPATISHDGEEYLSRSYRTTNNTVTAWWDASQIYGHDDVSAERVLRDPEDPAKLLQAEGYLPLLDSCSPDCSVQPQWQGQEAAAFPDNWNIGLSFYHNLFVREHNSFVERFRQLQAESPDEDSGLRNPAQPDQVITYAEASDKEIYEAGRLVVSAMIAKIGREG